MKLYLLAIVLTVWILFIHAASNTIKEIKNVRIETRTYQALEAMNLSGNEE